MKGRHGFTMIELMLTLGLISIFILIITPKTNIYSNYYSDMELNTLRRDLYATRSRAVSEGKTYSFNVTEGGDGYFIEDNNNKTIKRVRFDKIRFLTSSYSGFYFTAQGGISNSNTIEVRDANNESYELKVGVATGKITLEKVKD